MFSGDRDGVRRRGLVALAAAVALFAAGCGGSDSGGDEVESETPTSVTGADGDDGGGGDGAAECRTEIVEDEYGFEIEIEVCDDE